MKNLIVKLVLKAFVSKTSQNVAIAVVLAKLLVDLGERVAPAIPWQGTFVEVLTYAIGLAIAAVTTALVGRVAAEVRAPGKLDR